MQLQYTVAGERRVVNAYPDGRYPSAIITLDPEATYESDLETVPGTLDTLVIDADGPVSVFCGDETCELTKVLLWQDGNSMPNPLGKSIEKSKFTLINRTAEPNTVRIVAISKAE